MALPVSPAFGAMPGVMTGDHWNLPQPSMPAMAGMFGGGMSPVQMALSAAAAGFLARRSPQVASNLMQGVNDQRTLSRQAQLAMLRDNLEFNRQMTLAEQGARLKLQYPDGEFAQSEYQRGVQPGSQQWTTDWTTYNRNLLDPVVNAGPYGPVLRSQVAGAATAKPLTDADIQAMDGKGGPTPSASGGFLGSGSFPDIGPYHRY